MSQSHIEHKPMECTDRYCGIHRDLWRYYEDVIAPTTTYGNHEPQRSTPEGKLAEDVQLDVELIAREQAEALFAMYRRLEFSNQKVIEVLAKALLRRVSGKGAIQAAFEAVLPALKFTGLNVRVDNLADRGWNSAVRETKRSMESYLASPAPVPATPICEHDPTAYISTEKGWLCKPCGRIISMRATGTE